MHKKTFPYIPSDPFSLWQSLHKSPRHGFFLGSAAATERDHIVYFSVEEPIKIISSLSAVEKIFHKKNKGDIPEIVGVLSFEAGRHFDEGINRLKSQPDPLSYPEVLFGQYKSVVKLDFLEKTTTIFTNKKSNIKRVESSFLRRQESKMENLKGIVGPCLRRGDKFVYPQLDQFSKMVSQAKEAISKGDIYQANLSLRFEGSTSKSPIEIYKKLCRDNPSPFAALIKQGNQWVVSCSPELLFKVHGKKITTRPIAGTRPRGTTKKIDQKRKGQLLLSPKERAEHIMLVDLERNDLGRVAKAGSVKVEDQYDVERYSHVMHIVSSVNGILKEGKTSLDVLKAVFPGGTITGCPKIKSIEVIQELEKISRGPFYGSAGYFCANGDAQFNLLIRTALMRNKKVFIQAGAGIVADSQATREYKELKAKAQALLEAVK